MDKIFIVISIYQDVLNDVSVWKTREGAMARAKKLMSSPEYNTASKEKAYVMESSKEKAYVMESDTASKEKVYVIESDL